MCNYQSNIKAEWWRVMRVRYNPWANPSRFRHHAKLTRYYLRSNKGGRYVPPRMTRETVDAIIGNKEGRSNV